MMPVDGKLSELREKTERYVVYTHALQSDRTIGGLPLQLHWAAQEYQPEFNLSEQSPRGTADSRRITVGTSAALDQLPTA
jgi:hypothetical protein